MMIPAHEEHFGESNHFFVSLLRGFGFNSRKPIVFHHIPSLTDKSTSSQYGGQIGDYSPGKSGSEPNYVDPNHGEISPKIQEETPANWADTRLAYRKSITIDYTKVVSSYSNFPLYVELYDSDLHDHVAQSNGSDIVFANDGGSIIDYEIESFDQTYNSTHAKLVAWVETAVSSSSDTTIWLYYGNNTISSLADPGGIWNFNYEAVWHMNNNPSTSNILDSTSNNNDLTAYGMTSDQRIQGQVGSAITFDGLNDFLNGSGLTGPRNDWTIDFWFKLDDGHDSESNAWAIGHGDTSSHNAPKIVFQNTGKASTSYEQGTSQMTLTGNKNSWAADTWYYFAFTYEHEWGRHIVDGVQDRSTFSSSWEEENEMKHENIS